VIGVVASVAAAFFYLRVIVLMYMQEPQGSMDEDRSLMPRVAIAIPAILTLVLGIFPGLIVGILERASILRW
jgi:NADH-quinone oxidoreductase subunit N